MSACVLVTLAVDNGNFAELPKAVQCCNERVCTFSEAGLHRNGRQFPLGRGYLPIDQYELAAEKAHEELPC
eukprot:2067717-Amphidinium_carterae.1